VSYVWAAYSVTLGGLALYALRVLRRGRALARTLPPEERTWR
jgi:heme exporter protein CcmD